LHSFKQLAEQKCYGFGTKTPKNATILAQLGYFGMIYFTNVGKKYPEMLRVVKKVRIFG